MLPVNGRITKPLFALLEHFKLELRAKNRCQQ